MEPTGASRAEIMGVLAWARMRADEEDRKDDKYDWVHDKETGRVYWKGGVKMPSDIKNPNEEYWGNGSDGKTYPARGGKDVKLGKNGHWEYVEKEEVEAKSNGGSGWDATNTTLGALGLASGIKETMIEGGAALTRGAKIYNVNTTSIIRTYGASGAKYLKYSKALGVAGSVVSTGYSGYIVYEQYNKGGANEVFQHRDVWDAGVGTVGLGATGLAAFGIITNPVGWTIGIGALVYGGVTLIYDTVT